MILKITCVVPAKKIASLLLWPMKLMAKKCRRISRFNYSSTFCSCYSIKNTWTLECLPHIWRCIFILFSTQEVTLSSPNISSCSFITGKGDTFLITGLTPGLDYSITVSRLSHYGKSAEVTLEALTLRTAENRMSMYYL